MREIEFMAYDRRGEFKMLRVSQLNWEVHADGVERMHFHGKLPDKMDKSGEIVSGFGTTDGTEDISPWVFLQYTGLRDKNGQKAYHKQICMDELWNLWLIEWSDNDAAFELRLLTKEEPDYYHPHGGWVISIKDMVKDMVIVADAYQNPELLAKE